MARSFLVAAVHKGPYQAVRPLEEHLGPGRVTYLLEGLAGEERGREGLPYFDLAGVRNGWGTLENFVISQGIGGVVRGTSEGVVESNVEESAAGAAQNVGIPVAVVEDFPGNYWPKPGGRVDSLFLDDESLVDIYQKRGVDPNVVHVTGCPRYDSLAAVDRQAKRASTRMALGLDTQRVMLWAGQPDGENSFLALQRLSKGCAGQPLVLLFRAHPRDEAYREGSYKDLLQVFPFPAVDVTSYDDVVGLYCASDLVATQFSSAGVEAGHLGVPALFVLFDDLAKQYLRTHKGFDTLPWCLDRCSFLIEEVAEVQDVLQEALFDEKARAQVRANFYQRFGSRTDRARRVAQQILTMADESRAKQVVAR